MRARPESCAECAAEGRGARAELLQQPTLNIGREQVEPHARASAFLVRLGRIMSKADLLVEADGIGIGVNGDKAAPDRARRPEAEPASEAHELPARPRAYRSKVLADRETGNLDRRYVLRILVSEPFDLRRGELSPLPADPPTYPAPRQASSRLTERGAPLPPASTPARAADAAGPTPLGPAAALARWGLPWVEHTHPSDGAPFGEHQARAARIFLIEERDLAPRGPTSSKRTTRRRLKLGQMRGADDARPLSELAHE